MTVRIGHAVMETGPYSMSHQGDSMVFGIDINPGDVDEAKALRQQLTGLVTGQVVPLTWDLDSDWDGFYEVTQPPVVSPIVTYLESGFMRCVVAMRRIGGGYGAPRLVVANKTTLLPASSSDGWLWLASESVAGSGAAMTEQTTAFGKLYGSGTLASAAQPSLAYSATPEQYQSSACRIEFELGGVWYAAHGKQLPPVGASRVRINNGVMRASYSSAAGLFVECWNAGTWEELGTFPMMEHSVGTTFQPVGLARVLRNEGTDCVLQWDLETSATNNAGLSYLQVRVQRGKPTIEATLFGWIVDAEVRVGGDVGAAGATSRTNGFKRSTSNADGHVYVLGDFDSSDTISTSGVGSISGESPLNFGIIAHISESAVSPWTEGAAFFQYWVAVSSRERVTT